MCRNNEKQFDAETCLESIRETRKRLSSCDFQGIERYLIGKRDKTIMLFLELGEIIEKNIDIFFCPNIRWRDRFSNKSFGKETGQNPVHFYVQGDGILYVWLDKGILFIWNEKTKRAVFISHNKGGTTDYHTYNTYHGFHFFDEWVNGGYPSNGYERFSVTPTMENYFPKEQPIFLQDYMKLKEKVDDDYENALLCKQLLEEGLKEILESEKKYLRGMRELNLL